MGFPNLSVRAERPGQQPVSLPAPLSAERKEMYITLLISQMSCSETQPELSKWCLTNCLKSKFAMCHSLCPPPPSLLLSSACLSLLSFSPAHACSHSHTAHLPSEPKQQHPHADQHFKHSVQEEQLRPQGPLHPPSTVRALHPQVTHRNTHRSAEVHSQFFPFKMTFYSLCSFYKSV